MDKLNRGNESRSPCLVGGNSLLKSAVALDVGVVADGASPVPEEALVDALE